MKISKQQLIDMKACEDGLKRFVSQTNNTEEPVEVISLIGGENTTSYLLWLAGKILPKDKIVRFACDVALLNVYLIKPYTDKFDLIVAFLKNPTNAARAARADTADVADAAVDAVAAAADVAYDAARAVVYAASASSAARAAARAARAAARAAADAADAVSDTAAAVAADDVAAVASSSARAAAASARAAAINSEDKINELLIKLFTE